MNQWNRPSVLAIASHGAAGTTTGSASPEEEYIDYSCSTPLERLARDIETIFRKWHVHETDRHVSSSSSSSSFAESPFDATASTSTTATTTTAAVGKSSISTCITTEQQQQQLLFSTPPRSTASSKHHNATLVGNSISSKKSIPTYPTTTSSINPTKNPTFFPSSSSSSSVVVLGGPDSTTPLSHTSRTNLTTNTHSTSTMPWSPSSTSSSATASVSNRSMSHYSLTNATLKSSSIHSTPITTPATTNAATNRNVRCLRQRMVTFYPTPNPQSLHFLLQQHGANKVDPALHRGIPLILSLWDGPPTYNHKHIATKTTTSAATIQQQQLPWSLQHLLANSNTKSSSSSPYDSSLAHPSDLSSLLSIGQHITLTPPPTTKTNTSTNTTTSSPDHHQNLLETIIQLHYLPSITTALNIALSYAACAIPAFVLGTYYDPSITTSSPHKSVTTTNSLVPQRYQTYFSSSSKTSFTNNSATSIFTSISRNQEKRKQQKTNIVPQQHAILRPIPNWLFIGNTATINSIQNLHDSFCIPSSTSTSTMVVAHCLPVDCCSFPTSLHVSNKNTNASSIRGIFHLQVLSDDDIPEPLKYYSNCSAALSFLEDQMLSSQQNRVVSSIVYTFEWDKNKECSTTLTKSSQHRRGNSLLLPLHQPRDEINYYKQDDPFFDSPSKPSSTPWYVASLRRDPVVPRKINCTTSDNENEDIYTQNARISPIFRLIHTYEILAGTSKASILRFMDDLSTYNEVKTSLKDLSFFLVEKKERYYDDDDEGTEFLIGPSTDPIERILLHLRWSDVPKKNTDSLPVSISVQCSWDKFIRRPVAINPLSAHVRYVFASYIFAVSTFTPYSSREDWITGSDKAATSSLLYDEYFRPYIGTTTNKLFVAMKAMWLEQQLNRNNDAHSMDTRKESLDQTRIVKNVHGIVQQGGLWSENNPSNPQETHCNNSLISFGTPFGRVLSLLCFYMSRQSDPRMMMVAWNAFVEELRVMWEKRRMVPNTGFSCNTTEEHTPQQQKDDGINYEKSSYYIRRHGTSCGDCHTDVDRESSILDQYLQFFNVGVAFALEAENKVPIPDVPLSAKKKRGKHHFMPIMVDSDIPRTPVLHPLNTTVHCPTKDVRFPGSAFLNNLMTENRAIKKSFWCCSESKRKRLPFLYCNSNNKNQSASITCATVEETARNDTKPCQSNTRSVSHPDLLAIQDNNVILATEFSSARLSPMSDISHLQDKQSDNSVASEMEIESDTISKPVRRGARFPIVSLFLSNGNQIYEPILQNKSPITSLSLLHRRFLAAMEYRMSDRDPVDAYMKIRKFFQYPVLRSDMQAFKAANPGCIFNDFVRWYGSPSEPIDVPRNVVTAHNITEESNRCLFNEEQLFENALRRHFSRGPVPLDNNNASILSAESLMELENFWNQIWDDTKPIPAFEQDLKLFDALQEVEKIIYSLENLSPIQLLNYVLEINFTTAYELLHVRAGDALKVRFIQTIFSRLAEKTRATILQLKEDSFFFTLGLEHPRGSSYLSGEKILLPMTLKTSESLCNAIGEVELILSRASSLLHKFPGQYDLVHHLMTMGVGEEYQLTLHNKESQLSAFQSIQEGILSLLGDPTEMLSASRSCSEDSKNSFDTTLPLALAREFVLNSSDENQLYRLLAQTRGGPNEDEVCILAISRCLKS